jgi:hypothetical protein
MLWESGYPGSVPVNNQFVPKYSDNEKHEPDPNLCCLTLPFQPLSFRFSCLGHRARTAMWSESTSWPDKGLRPTSALSNSLHLQAPSA